LWFLIFAVVAALGIVFQLRVNRTYEIAAYNRWNEQSAV
jgi:hypothetical protein